MGLSDTISVGEFAPFNYGKGLPEIARRAGAVAVYGSNGVVGRHSEALTDGPTVIIGRKGTVGRLHFSRAPCWPIDTTFFITGSDEELVRFKYYALSTLQLDEMNSDSAIPGLNRDAAHLRRLRRFSTKEQREIARILGTLDDRIELTRRTNETLEAMARALFKSWFVDFDPVRAKAEGRAPSGMDAETARLFPNEFVDSELGPTPKGWSVITVADLLSLEYGKALKESLRQPGHVLVFGSNGVVGRHSQALVRGQGIVVGRKGNPGTVTWAPSDFFVIDTAFFVAPKESKTSLRFLRHLLETLDLPQLAADSAVPGVNRNAILTQIVVRPSHDIVSRFHKLADEWGRLVTSLADQSSTLADIRDALLSRLLAGELAIAEAERTVEAIT